MREGKGELSSVRWSNEAKVAKARNLWVPAVNDHGGFGRWDFIETEDPWGAQTRIRVEIEKWSKQGGG